MDKVVISIIGKSGSGKTTLLEKVIKLIKEKGLRIAVIKHDAHSFEMDKPGKDTWRHTQAGADIVAISSSEKFAMIEKREEALKLDEIIDRINGVDIILTEGFRREDKPKIEVFRSAAHSTLLCEPSELIAIVSDIELDIDVPWYHIDDAEGVTEKILKIMEKMSRAEISVENENVAIDPHKKHKSLDERIEKYKGEYTCSE